MDPTRREFIRRTLAATMFLAVGGVAALEYLSNPGSTGGQATQQTLLQTSQQQSGTQTGTPAVPAGYLFVTGVAALAGKSSAYFNHPTAGLSLLINLGGGWKAFSATCTHAPCTVQYSTSSIQCPCHGGVFDPSTGAVLSGPPPTKLPEFGVVIQNGSLYVSESAVN